MEEVQRTDCFTFVFLYVCLWMMNRELIVLQTVFLHRFVDDEQRADCFTNCIPTSVCG